MNSYTDEGVAHAELLLVTCLRKENPPGNEKLPPASASSVRFLLASSTSKQNQSQSCVGETEVGGS